MLERLTAITTACGKRSSDGNNNNSRPAVFRSSRPRKKLKVQEKQSV